MKTMLYAALLTLTGVTLAADQPPIKNTNKTVIKIAQATTDKGKDGASESAKPKKRVRYIPPVKGAPKVRVGGGVRGSDSNTLEIEVVAPDHVSLTATAQPVLYWYQSFDGKGKSVQVTVLRPRKPKPVLKVTLDSTVNGLNKISLADHQAKLDPNIDYQWVVSYVSDKQGRWKDVLAGAMIRHRPADDKVAGLLKGAPSEKDVFALLEHGLWYDGWAGLVGLIDRNPGNKALAEVRNDLITQIGLKPGIAKD
jgi:hypothetical protein